MAVEKTFLETVLSEEEKLRKARLELNTALIQDAEQFPEGKTPGIVAARHFSICHMAALGFKSNQIAERMQLSPGRVSTILNSVEGKLMLADLKKKLFAEGAGQMFRAMAPRAAHILFHIMNKKDEKGSTRVAAAEAILDRAYGKPTQEIKHESSTLKELFEALDKRQGPRITQSAEDVVAEFREILPLQTEINKANISEDQGDTHDETRREDASGQETGSTAHPERPETQSEIHAAADGERSQEAAAEVLPVERVDGS